ncbi:MAG: hypothetical protein LBO20_03815 [Bifidobacteriaceae bacterium]|jgi:hypothetical protein|nr:hypothetical protein [Bifidobacteriaceae bacterium]
MRRVGVAGKVAAIGLVAAVFAVGGCRGEDAAPRESVASPGFDQPSDVPGEALSFEEVKTRSGSMAGGLDEPWVRVVSDDAELRDLWFDQEDRGVLVGSPAVDEVPPIPEGATALWLCAGWESHGVGRQVEGVYESDGEWVVAAYAVRYDTGDEIVPAIVWGHRAVLFVDAPPPKSVRIRVEDRTGGELDGLVTWGGAPPEPSPAPTVEAE